MRLSIIVPVYNVEQYVRLCLESLFQQGLDEQDVEVIIVNDGTQDRSMEAIQDIICLHQNITVISQDNLGLSAADRYQAPSHTPVQLSPKAGQR